MKAITDADYTAEPVCKDFEIKNLDEYHDLYVQSDYCQLIYLTTSGICACLEIYRPDLSGFHSASELAGQAEQSKKQDLKYLVTLLF